MQVSSRPKGLIKIWREIKRPFRKMFGFSSSYMEDTKCETKCVTPQNILLIGEKFSSNLGDGVICETMQWLLENLFSCNIYTLDISGRENYEEQKKFRIYIPYRLSRLWKKYVLKYPERNLCSYRQIALIKQIKQVFHRQEKFDLVVFAGGQMFLDYFAFQVETIVRVMREKGCPVVFSACGVGAVDDERLRGVFRQSLSDNIVKHISTRDNYEYINREFLCGTNKTAIRTYDPAIFADEFYGIKKNEKAEIIGLGVISIRNQGRRILDFYCAVIDILNRENRPWQLFCNGGEGDFALAKEILLRTNEREQKLADRPMRPIELVKLLAGYKSIISFRLHSHIVAYSLGIPSIGIVWDNKLNWFFKSIQCENRCKELEESVEIIYKELVIAENERYDDTIREFQKETIKSNMIGMIGQFINLAKV